jgi:hypothetical protein
MNRALQAGASHATLSPLVCEDIRALTLAAQTGRPATFSQLVVRSFWMLLISAHAERYREAPSHDDCESYRLLAELVTGDAISAIDAKLRDLFEAAPANEDTLLLEARTLFRFTQALQREESLREQRAVEAVCQRAAHYAREVT